MRRAPSSGPAAAPVQAPAQTQAQTTPPAIPPKAVPAQLPEVVARVNGEAIGKAEFESAVRNLEGRAGGQVPADQRDRVYRGVLDQLIAYRLLIQETKARKMASKLTAEERRTHFNAAMVMIYGGPDAKETALPRR